MDGRWGGGDSSLPRKFMADMGAERCELLLKYCLTILHSYFERLSGWEIGGGDWSPLKNVWQIQIFFNNNDKLVTNDKMMGWFGMMGWNIPLTIRADYLLKLIRCEWLGDGLEMGGGDSSPLENLQQIQVRRDVIFYLNSLTILHSYFERLRWMWDGGGDRSPLENVWQIQIFFNDNDKLVTNEKMMGWFGVMGWDGVKYTSYNTGRLPFETNLPWVTGLEVGDGLEKGGGDL